MVTRVLTVLTLLLVLGAAAQEKDKSQPLTPAEQSVQGKGAPALPGKYKWLKGPARGALGQAARIDVPEGFVFTGAEGTQGMLRDWGNPTSGEELGFLAPASMDWSVVFEFADVGYVKDDEKANLDAEKLLKSIKAGTERSNKLRQKMGAPPLHVTGWQQPPRYNAETHNLEWAIRGESGGHQVVNYNTRLLGRKGVMSVTLLVDPEQMTSILPAYQGLLQKYSFNGGEGYAEYRPGDKLAKYGLTALIVGGAAVGAAKLGLFAWLAVALKKFWKIIVVAVVALAASVRRLIFGPSGSEPRT